MADPVGDAVATGRVGPFIVRLGLEQTRVGPAVEMSGPASRDHEVDPFLTVEGEGIGGGDHLGELADVAGKVEDGAVFRAYLHLRELIGNRLEGCVGIGIKGEDGCSR